MCLSALIPGKTFTVSITFCHIYEHVTMGFDKSIQVHAKIQMNNLLKQIINNYKHEFIAFRIISYSTIN